MRRAAFAGSFDPWTDGHTKVVLAGLQLFDEVIVMVADNPLKKYMFSDSERVQIADTSIMYELARREVDVSRCRVIRMAEGYTADHAKALGCCALLRGIRCGSNPMATQAEIETEETVAHFARARGIETAVVMTGSLVSSTRIRSRSAPEYDGQTITMGISECPAVVKLVNSGLERARLELMPPSPLPARILDSVATPLTGEEPF